jgi:hypothetical protein
MAMYESFIIRTFFDKKDGICKRSAAEKENQGK